MRPHHPWYWAAKNAWFVEIGDIRHRLGQHPDDLPPPKKRKRGDLPPKPPKEIEQAYFRLMAADPASLPKAAELKVCQVCDLFLDFSEKHHAADTYRGALHKNAGPPLQCPVCTSTGPAHGSKPE